MPFTTRECQLDDDGFVTLDRPLGFHAVTERLDTLLRQFAALEARLDGVVEAIRVIENTAQMREARKQNQLLRRMIPFPFAAAATPYKGAGWFPPLEKRFPGAGTENVCSIGGSSTNVGLPGSGASTAASGTHER